MYSDLGIGLVVGGWGLRQPRRGALCAGHTPIKPLEGASPWGELVSTALDSLHVVPLR